MSSQSKHDDLLQWDQVTYKGRSLQCNDACAYERSMGKPCSAMLISYDIVTSCIASVCACLATWQWLRVYLPCSCYGAFCHTLHMGQNIDTFNNWQSRYVSAWILSSAWCHNSYAKSTSEVSSPLARVPKSCTRALNLLGLSGGVCIASRQNSWQLLVSKPPPDRSATILHRARLHVRCTTANCLCWWFTAHVPDAWHSLRRDFDTAWSPGVYRQKSCTYVFVEPSSL